MDLATSRHTTTCLQPGSLFSRARPSQCGAPDDRLSANSVHRAHNATRGCTAHALQPRPYTNAYHYIGITCYLVHMLPAGGSHRATDTGPLPPVRPFARSLVRSRCPLGRHSLSLLVSFFLPSSFCSTNGFLEQLRRWVYSRYLRKL